MRFSLSDSSILMRMGTVLFSAFLLISAAPTSGQLHEFANPIDALSIGVQTDTIDLQVSAKVNGSWLPWESLEIEKEFDPLLRESNMVMFPRAVTSVRVRGSTKKYEIHPIRISSQPPTYSVAALGTVGAPHILSRAEWGADENLLVQGEDVQRSDLPSEEATISDTDSSSSSRVQQCEEWQLNYPQEFRTIRKVTTDAQGRKLRWPQEYADSIKLLVVHHTALKVTGDERTGYERMRALYSYHANGRGWGDVGYHYIVDEKGQIYEGRAGGDKVVGGHAYCSNVGTIGVALMGNFEVEQPTQEQMKSLQWLLYDLARQYNINVATQVTYHGTKMERIVGHGDLVSTACPGYYVDQTLGQVRTHVQTGDVDVPVRFPRTTRRTTNEGITTPATTRRSINDPTLTAVGSTELSGLPGGQIKVTMLFRAGTKNAQQRDRIADVERSVTMIGLWQGMGQGRETRVRHELLLPESVRAGNTTVIPLRIQFPREEGTHTLQIGDVRYKLTVVGRRTVSPALRGRYIPSEQNAAARVQPSIVRNRPVYSSADSPSRANPRSTITQNSKDIRIRLGYEGSQAVLTGDGGVQLQGKSGVYNKLTLRNEFDTCAAYDGTAAVGRGIVQIVAPRGTVTIESWNKPTNRFRGMIECQVIDGQLVLINQLPLEQYIAGLAEEPDSEPYEKQRAFAIAARSYAAHYMESTNRKFPGMPYDGDDSPARFQMYGGVVFEERNPGWVRATESTAGIVVKKDGQIVKTAYFSSDDGRTRSPEENGWRGFPFAAEVFASKPDPWCNGMDLRGHGVGMSGCGSKGQALEGKTAEQILQYYYPSTTLEQVTGR